MASFCAIGGVIEEWRPIRSHEGIYDVSILGVRRIATGRILKPCLDSYGYPHVHLYLRGERTSHPISYLVADAFLPPKGPTDQVLRHLNDIKTDNRPENLAWGTYSDNMADSVRNGIAFVATGAAHWNAKLTEDQVREIRRLYATENFTQQELALKFGVSRRMVSDIVRRKTWKHVL